jgi:pilus assembly protein Flp/PilA
LQHAGRTAGKDETTMLLQMIQWVRDRFVKEEEGVTAIEYGLLAALIAVVIIIAVAAVGRGLNTTFNNVSTHLP